MYKKRHSIIKGIRPAIAIPFISHCILWGFQGKIDTGFAFEIGAVIYGIIVGLENWLYWRKK